MTAVVLAAAGLGFGILGIVVALRPGPHRLAVALDRLDALPGVEARPGDPGSGTLAGGRTGAGVVAPGAIGRIATSQGLAVARLVSRNDAVLSRLQPMLAVTGTSLDSLCAQAIGAAGAGALVPVLAWAVMAAGGVRLPIALPAWGVLLAAGAGVLVPVLALGADAKERRRQARRAVGSFLDLVVLAMAGGMGVEGALHAAAGIGTDWVSRRLSRSLALARDAGVAPWEALGLLGVELGVEELGELAAAVGLAGQEGARVKATLSAKAASIRRHELADAETAANTVTERMFLPGVILLAGFLVFVGYPALARILTGL